VYSDLRFKIKMHIQPSSPQYCVADAPCAAKSASELIDKTRIDKMKEHHIRRLTEKPRALSIDEGLNVAA